MKLCLETCYFQFNGKVYQQTNGLAMGNPLSAFAANCFMSEFETTAKNNNPNFPSSWFRFVDDVLVVINESNVHDFLNYLNGMNPRIRFTVETESNGSIPFLDMNLTRLDDKITFNVYRKPTSTERCIPNTSYHSKNTKLAAFNSFCFRAINFPLSEVDFEIEREKIYKIADINGYNRQIVDNLLSKHKRKKDLRDLTALTPIGSNDTTDDNENYYTGGIFIEGLTTKIGRILNGFSITLSPNSTAYKMKTLIGGVKDKLHTFKKSGVYAALCSGCKKVYVGRSGREVDTRFCEHYKPYHEGVFRKSTVADHMLENNHEFAGFRLLRAVNKPNYLDALERVYIYRTRNNNMNIQNANTVNTLLKFTKPLETKTIFNMKI